ncbi:MAG: GHMP family kinase ATP-binding protein [Candidatus Heimdallarchaeaceae archaeon]
MVSYWVASHITGLFVIHNETKDILYKGSRGAGFSISRGVYTSVDFSEDKNNHLFYNDTEISLSQAKVSHRVLDLVFQKVPSSARSDISITVQHNFEIPIGAGFGASAAGALGLAFALNTLLELNLSEKEIFGIAHSAEVLEGGGLGDIIGIFQGGWEYRVKAGSPFVGETKEMVIDHPYKIATISFGDMPTETIIKNAQWKQRINTIGNECFNRFVKNPTVTNFVKEANNFSVRTQLITKEIKNFYKKHQNAPFLYSQIMLGNGIFLLYNKDDDLTEIEEKVNKEILCKKTVKKIDS